MELGVKIDFVDLFTPGKANKTQASFLSFDFSATSPSVLWLTQFLGKDEYFWVLNCNCMFLAPQLECNLV